jgi:uncharacterized protein YggE
VLVCLLQDALLRASRGGENPYFAVGEYTVHVEKDEFDFFGAGLGHCVAILAFESGAPIDCPFAIATQAEVALPFLSSAVSMKLRVFLAVFFLASLTAFAQTPELKFIADTLVVQADGTCDADPDLATLTFQIFAQDKDIKRAYDTATRSIQRIVEIAQRNGLAKDDIRSGVLTVSPIYEGDRKKRARSYYVQGQEVLKVRDFAKIGPILDASVEDGVSDFRSLTYSLADEEAAKKKAVAEAMQRAIGRAAIALEQKGQKLGALRYMSLDVKQVYGVARLETFATATETVDVNGVFRERKAAPPMPPPQPHKDYGQRFGAVRIPDSVSARHWKRNSQTCWWAMEPQVRVSKSTESETGARVFRSRGPR